MYWERTRVPVSRGERGRKGVNWHAVCMVFLPQTKRTPVMKAAVVDLTSSQTVK